MSGCQFRPRALAALLAFPALVGAAGADCVTYADYIHPLDVHMQGGYLRYLVYREPHLFVAGQDGMLTVLDAADPSDLNVIGALALPGQAQQLAVRADVVAATFTDCDLLQLMDVAAPMQPALLGAVAIPAAPRSVALSATHAYVPAWDYMQSNHGVYVVDLSDLQEPEVVGRVEVEAYPTNIVLSGSYAYAIDSHGLTVLDLSTPAAPVPRGSVVIPGGPRYLAVRPPYVFVVCDAEEYPAPYNGLYMVDVSDPLAPWIAGTLVAEEAPHHGVGLWEHYALVGTYDAGFALIDISNPPELVIAAQIGVQSQVKDFCVDGSLLFAGPATIASYRLSEQLTPDPVAVVPETPETRLIATLGDHAYCLRDWGRDLYVVNLANPAAPQVTGSLPLELDYGTALAAAEMPGAGRYVYVGAAGSVTGIHIIDVTDPAGPFQAGFLPLAHGPSDLEVAGSRLYVMAGYLGLLTYDLSDPTQPLYQGSLTFVYSAQIVEAVGTTLYVGRRVGSGEKLFIIDASNPHALQILGTSSVPDLPYDFHVEGSLLYVADAAEGLLIMDVGDPSQPLLVSQLRTTERCQALALQGRFAYLADTGQHSGVQVVDVSMPQAPVLAGYYHASLPCDLEISNEHLLIATYHENLEIAPPACDYAGVAPAGPISRVGPRITLGANPCRDHAAIVLQMPRTADVRVTVHDLQGRLLSELHNGELAAGLHTLQWAGRTRLGGHVASGVYHVRVKAGGKPQSRPLAWIR